MYWISGSMYEVLNMTRQEEEEEKGEQGDEEERK